MEKKVKILLFSTRNKIRQIADVFPSYAMAAGPSDTAETLMPGRNGPGYDGYQENYDRLRE